MRSAVRARIELGLALLARRMRPGQRASLLEIAAWCDCSPQTIWEVERQALRRLRRRMATMKR